MTGAENIINNCVTLFFGYQTSDCLRPCKTMEVRSRLVSTMTMANKPEEMRIRIKFDPTVTVTTTDFVKPSLGVFMSEVSLKAMFYLTLSVFDQQKNKI